VNRPETHTPTRAHLERLVAQIRRLESRSGRHAVSVCIAAPPDTDVEGLRGALMEVLPTPDTEVTVEAQPGALRVLTVDFAMPKAAAK
jgi:hypothetical protein